MIPKRELTRRTYHPSCFNKDTQQWMVPKREFTDLHDKGETTMTKTLKPSVSEHLENAEYAVAEELMYQASKWSDLDEKRPMTPADHLALLTLYVDRANIAYQLGGANARDVTTAQDSLRKIAAIAIDGMCTHGVRTREQEEAAKS